MNYRWQSEIIRHYLKEAGLTQGDLAIRLGYSYRQGICAWSQKGIPLDRLREVQRMLDIPKDKLIKALLDDYEEMLKEKLE